MIEIGISGVEVEVEAKVEREESGNSDRDAVCAGEAEAAAANGVVPACAVNETDCGYSCGGKTPPVDVCTCTHAGTGAGTSAGTGTDTCVGTGASDVSTPWLAGVGGASVDVDVDPTSSSALIGVRAAVDPASVDVAAVGGSGGGGGGDSGGGRQAEDCDKD